VHHAPRQWLRLQRSENLSGSSQKCDDSPSAVPCADSARPVSSLHSGKGGITMENRLAVVIALGMVVAVNSTAQAGISPDLKCGDAKAKAAGLKASDLLTTFMNNKKKPNPDKLSKKISKAQSLFTKAFTKAEAKGGCVASGDSATIEAEVDGFVAAVIALLCPADTTTTTNTTVTSSSSTSSTSTSIPSTTSTSTSVPSTTSTSTTNPPASSTSTTTTPATSSTTTTTTTMPASGSLVINEIDYDQPDSDDQEFVEIWNPTAGSVNLDSLALVFVNGADSNEYRRVDLSGGGVLTAGQYLVVGSPLVAVPPSALKLDLPTSGVIQNGPDGVAIVNTATEDVLDALSYEGEIPAANVAGFSETVNLVEGTAFDGADSGTETLTLVRSPNGADTDNAISDWAVTSNLTPGEANL